MEFITNNIQLGKGKTLEDILAEIRSKNVKKADHGSVQRKPGDGPESGQTEHGDFPELTNNPEAGEYHDEKDPYKTKNPSGAKKACEKPKTDFVQRKPGDGPESGQTEHGDFPELTNDPKAGEYHEGEDPYKKDKKLSQKKKCMDKVESDGLPKEDGKEEEENGVKVAKKKDKEEDKKDKKECCTKSAKKNEDKDEEKEVKELEEDGPDMEERKEEEQKTEDEEEDGDDDQDKLASTTQKFIKVSKLNKKSKNFLLNYWKQLYPKEYANEMVIDT